MVGLKLPTTEAVSNTQLTNTNIQKAHGNKAQLLPPKTNIHKKVCIYTYIHKKKIKNKNKNRKQPLKKMWVKIEPT